MEEVRNAAGKKVCCIDKENHAVVIIVRDMETIITFNSDGTYMITNNKCTA